MKFLYKTIKTEDSEYTKKLLKIYNAYSFFLTLFFLGKIVLELFFKSNFRLYIIIECIVFVIFSITLMFTRIKLNKNFIAIVYLLIIVAANVEIFFNPFVYFFTFLSIGIATIFFYYNFFTDKKHIYTLITLTIIPFLITFYLSIKFIKNIEINNTHQFAHSLLSLCFFCSIIYCFVKKQKLIYETRQINNETNLDNKSEEFDFKEPSNVINIIELAKNNDEGFFVVFTDAYPTIISNLKNRFPNLTITEQKFCAMLYLKFSTKEIANFTNISHRSVQNKKYNLRKKLNLEGNTDLYLFLEDLNNNNLKGINDAL